MSTQIKKAKIKKGSNSVKPETVAELLVKAGGRCSFNGCNDYLLTDSLTLHKYNASNVAHIVGKSVDGPRGTSSMTLKDRNKIGNLILVCRKHHALIDNKNLVKKYPISLLEKYKKEHEARILRLTGIAPDRKTKVITFKYKIGQEMVVINNEDVYDAIHPFYPTENNLEIDCTVGDIGTTEYYASMAEDIKNKIEQMYQQEEIKHTSVLALAPMPLLIYLGYCLSNKIKTELYQRHRTVPETWNWPKKKSEIFFDFKKINEGEKNNVALILSLSGTIKLEDLPVEVQKFNVYIITLKSELPAPTFLKSKNTMNNFKEIYQIAIRTIKEKENAETIHLFPAMPAPIAVLCGRELLKKIDPDVMIYDNNKSKGGFYPVLTIKNK